MRTARGWRGSTRALQAEASPEVRWGEGSATRDQGPVSTVTARAPGGGCHPASSSLPQGPSRLSLGARTQRRSCGRAGVAPTFRLLELLQMLARLLQAQVQLVAGAEQAQQVAGAPGAPRAVHEPAGCRLPEIGRAHV